MTSSSPDARRSRLDFWQACTGFLLALFICVHLLLEGTCILSPSITNGIAWFMEATYMAQLAAPIIVVLIVIHFFIAARKMPFRAGELGIFVRHSRAFKERDTWLWLVQVFTAIVILVCAFAHVWAVMTNMPIESAKSAARLHSGWLAFYALFLPCVVLHTGIGLYRLGVKFGVCTSGTRQAWTKWAWIGMGAYFLIGVAAIARPWFSA